MTKYEIKLAVLRKGGVWSEEVRTLVWDDNNWYSPNLKEYADKIAEDRDLEFFGNPDVITVVVFDIVERDDVVG
jgi:hypothetical protein